MANFWRVLEFDKFAVKWPLLKKNLMLNFKTFSFRGLYW